MKKILLSLSILGFSIHNYAQKENPDLKAITYEDLQSIRNISGIKLSPNGDPIAFELGGKILLNSITGAEPMEIGNGFHIVWSHDGKSIAYINRIPDKAEFQIFSYLIESDEQKQLTTVEGGINPTSFDWSAKDVLAFTASSDRTAQKPEAVENKNAPIPANKDEGTPLILNESSTEGYAFTGIFSGASDPRNNFNNQSNEVFIYDLKSKQTVKLTDSSLENFTEIRWSPDGNLLACIANTPNGKRFSSKVYLIDPTTREKSLIDSPKETIKRGLQWSPSKDKLAYIFNSFTDATAHGIAMISLKKDYRKHTIRTVLSDKVSSYSWKPNGESLYVAMLKNDVAQPLVEKNLVNEKEQFLSDPFAVVFEVSSSDNGAITWTESTGTKPSVINFMQPSETVCKEVYDANPHVRSWKLGKQEIINWENSHGHSRFGVLIKPFNDEEGKKYPLIVSCYSQGTHLNAFQSVAHGGYANQEFASKGYAVFFPGPRLPWMYGAWANTPEEADLIKGATGWEITVDDIESGVNYLIDKGIVDPERMILIGHSNGGAAATAVVTKTDRYKGAAIVAPANLNWLNLAIYRDDISGRFIPASTFTGIERDMVEDPQSYLNGSLVFKAHQINTPLLLAIGDNDHWSFTLPTLELYLLLRSHSKEVTYLRYPDQRHLLFGQSGKDLYDRIAEFIEQQLRK